MATSALIAGKTSAILSSETIRRRALPARLQGRKLQGNSTLFLTGPCDARRRLIVAARSAEAPPAPSQADGPYTLYNLEEEEGGRAVRASSAYSSNGSLAASLTPVPSAGAQNGAASTSTNGAASRPANGAAATSTNGAAVKPANGAASATLASSSFPQSDFARLEDLNKTDRPWFEANKNVQVSVSPGGKWNKFKAYSAIQRTIEIWTFVFTFLVRTWLLNKSWAYRGGVTEEKKTARRQELAKWLKEGLLRLGPTFIKIGQQFSTRSDILAPEYIAELSELQDQVPPFESEVALAIVEKELGRPIYEVFDSFDKDPIAAASLGQVHKARLHGREVVVKVQRPGLKALFDIDLKNLRVIAENLQKIDPKSDGAKRDWVAIYDECASVLYEEIDYTKEGQNADQFRENFKDLEYVKVPRIHWEYTTPQVLVMEYVPGIKINRLDALDKLGVDRERLARYCVESYLEQILRHGFFHADPHPGNIAVDDVNGGRLIFYDFGMMGSISAGIREGLVETFYGVYEKDPDKVIDSLVQMGVLVPTGDRTAIRRTAVFFLNNFEERLSAQQKEKEQAKSQGMALQKKQPINKEEALAKRKQRLAAIGEDLLSIAADQPFRFPATFTFVVRAFSVLDGIGKGLDPRFDISEIAKPYALELLRFREIRNDAILKEFKKRWDRQAMAFKNLLRQPDRVEKLAEVINRLEQGDLKLRVRTLENERAFKRVAVMQDTMVKALAAATLINMATVLHTASKKAPFAMAVAAGIFLGLQALVGLFRVKKLDEQEKLIMGIS